MKTVIALILGLALLGGGYYYVMSSSAPQDTSEVAQQIQQVPLPVAQFPVEQGTTTASTEPSTASSTTAAASPQGAVKEFNVTNSGMVFSEKTLTVNKGDKVRITYKNGGGTHDFRIEGYNIGTKVIKAGEMETFEFTADKAGEYEFYCSVGNHRAMGMKGTFTVK